MKLGEEVSAAELAEAWQGLKKARDELAHGLISQFDDLPVAKLRDLVRKYLDLALQRLLP
jgi:hypothetical protein